MKIRKNLIILAVALMGAVFIAPSAASAYDDGDACYHIADSRGNIALTLTAGLNRLTGSFALNGEIIPIPQNGGADATAPVNSYTWNKCQQGAQFKLVVKKGGKRVGTFRWSGSSDPNTGKLQLSGNISKKYAALKGGEKVKYRLKGYIWDKDQTITYVDQTDSLRVKSRTFVQEIT